jgi:hypothetical protein
MRYLCLLVVVGLAMAQISALPNFFRGKRLNHLRRAPEQEHLLSAIPDQYFDQRLDHFNEAQTDTWKQVKNRPIFSQNSRKVYFKAAEINV